jgi:60 kDa SS-A/Ro ribonucleoprotein
MTNKALFSSRTKRAAKADTRNAAGGRAYKSSVRHALAQITATNCFNSTYYVNAKDNLKIAKDAALQLASSDPLFVAKCAVYGRDKAYMKDMPAFLTVVLADVCRDLPVDDPNKTLFRRVFRRVIDNGKMLRNFIAIARSGAATGRKFNMGSGSIRHAIRDWFRERNSWAIFKASVGNDPSMRDILRMARPKPESAEKEALYAYLKGGCYDKGDRVFRTWKLDAQGNKYLAHEHAFEALPDIVKQYEGYKSTREGTVPNVDFRLLDSLGLGKEEWTEIARNARWMMTRMNLNTFQRHGVFDDPEMVQLVADRLRDAEEVVSARAFPYQLFMAYKAASGVPHEVQEALQDAMDLSLNNVPEIQGNVFICVDVSGSMGCGVTGFRRGATTQVRCVDQAALFASALLRKNPQATVLPFDTSVHQCRLNPRDTVITNCEKLSRYGGGGTNCSLPLALLNQRRAKVDAVIFISDYESWVDSGYHYYGRYGNGTGMLEEWQKLQAHNPKASLVCMDLTPRPNAQVTERPGILQVGGFGDAVFDVVASFVEHGHKGADHWVSEIDKVEV